jgi:hypothetical protein
MIGGATRAPVASRHARPFTREKAMTLLKQAEREGMVLYGEIMVERFGPLGAPERLGRTLLDLQI